MRPLCCGSQAPAISSRATSTSGRSAWLLVGSLPGVLIGSHVSVRLPDRVLQLALAVTLAASGAKLLDLPYANETAILTLVAGLIALVVFARTHRVAPPATAGARPA